MIAILQRPAVLFTIIFVLTAVTDAQAQYRTSTISGIVRTDDGQPVRDVRVRFTQNGQTRFALTDSAGTFSFYFAPAGAAAFSFERVSTSEIGVYNAVVQPGSSLNLAVVLSRGDQRNISNTWFIRQDDTKAPEPSRPAHVLTEDYLETLPGTEHLWSLLNQTEPSAVADTYDTSGLHSDRPFLIGVRGSSWSQNQSSVNGLTVSHPSGDGMLAFPDMSAMEAIVYSIGDSPGRHTGPGAHMEWVPKQGQQELHGQSQLYFQGEGLQNSNVTARERTFGITQPDQRWKQFLDGGFQLGGPLGRRPWTYFTAISGRDLDKWIRNQPLPVSSSVGQESFNFSGQLSARNRLNFYGSAQERNEPQAGASPQVTRESSIKQFQSYRQAQASWTRSISSRSLLEVRFGVAVSNLKSGFQQNARGQSVEEMFPGYHVDGLSPLFPPGSPYNVLSNTTRGPAALVTSFDAGASEGSATYSTVRDGFRHSNHRLAMGASYRHSSLTERNESMDGVNLLFFQQQPNSVRLLNTPTRTRDGIGQLELSASDTLSFSRLSFEAGLSADASRGASSLISGQSVNNLHWWNTGGRVAAAYRALERRPLVLRAALARIYDQPLVSAWTAANPEGSGVRLYSWNDSNGNLLFQNAENSQLLKVYGAPYTRMDPKLENPGTSELTLGVTQSGLGKFTIEMSGYRRTVQRLMTLVNEGVPFSSYTPVQYIDPGPDAVLGTADDHPLTVYNQKPETLGKDRYVLSNPDGFSSHSEGMELKLKFAGTKIQAEAALTRYRAVAATGPGDTARENDTSAFLGVYADPNNAINARGSTFFDRGTLGRLWVTAEPAWKIRASLIASYQDGLPYSRVLPIEGLHQGIVGVLTTQRGPGEAGSVIGPMTTHYDLFDVRLLRSFALRSFAQRNANVVGTLDIFNLTNRSQPLVEVDATSPMQHWRVPLRFQAPRSLQLGIRLTW